MRSHSPIALVLVLAGLVALGGCQPRHQGEPAAPEPSKPVPGSLEAQQAAAEEEEASGSME
mgnify:CR=1 FL=1